MTPVYVPSKIKRDSVVGGLVYSTVQYRQVLSLEMCSMSLRINRLARCGGTGPGRAFGGNVGLRVCN